MNQPPMTTTKPPTPTRAATADQSMPAAGMLRALRGRRWRFGGREHRLRLRLCELRLFEHPANPRAPGRDESQHHLGIPMQDSPKEDGRHTDGEEADALHPTTLLRIRARTVWFAARDRF